jgi:AcrR family transcriptional regulator
MSDEAPGDVGGPPATAGRPRDSTIDERVLAATRASLAEIGWERTSVRGIAERAGASRAAIARRWPSKAHLALEAILGATPDLGAFGGVDLQGWVDAVVDGSFALFDRADVRAAAPGLLATLRDHDDVRTALWEGFSGPASARLLDPGGDLGASGHRPDPASAEQLQRAQAAIAVAAGAALFTSLVVGDEQVRERVVAALGEMLRAMVDLPAVDGAP